MSKDIQGDGVPWASFGAWKEQVPRNIKADALWKFDTYQLALFFSDLAWHDSEKLLTEPRGKRIAHQLIGSSGSISANIEEGFGRGYGRDYARFLRIALGSARESRGWYYRGRYVFTETLLAHRMSIIDQVISGLVTTASQQRRK